MDPVAKALFRALLRESRRLRQQNVEVPLTRAVDVLSWGRGASRGPAKRMATTLMRMPSLAQCPASDEVVE